MGFGLLFIGYFFLLNLTYFEYTDLIGALIMFLSFYKLQPVNKYFRFAMIPTGLFGAIGIAELINALLSALDMGFGEIVNYTATSRYLFIGFITIFMLMGIEGVAREVDVPVTKMRAKITLPAAYIIFASASVLEFPNVGALIPEKALAVIALIVLLLVFIQMIMTLVTIYSAYMHICMPEDVNNDAKDTPSRFGFVNKFREHEDEQNKKYAEYRMDKVKKRNERRSKKKK